MNKLDLEETTRRFYDIYEQVAKEYGYKTREDPKELDFNSPNGMTMLKTVEVITTPYLEEIERLNNIINELEKYINEEYVYDELGMKIFDASKLQDKLQELKGEDKTFNERVEEIYNRHIDYIYDKEDKKIEKITNMNCIDAIDSNCYERYSNKAIALDINTLRHQINKVIDYIKEENK